MIQRKSLVLLFYLGLILTIFDAELFAAKSLSPHLASAGKAHPLRSQMLIPVKELDKDKLFLRLKLFYPDFSQNMIIDYHIPELRPVDMAILEVITGGNAASHILADLRVTAQLSPNKEADERFRLLVHLENAATRNRTSDNSEALGALRQYKERVFGDLSFADDFSVPVADAREEKVLREMLDKKVDEVLIALYSDLPIQPAHQIGGANTHTLTQPLPEIPPIEPDARRRVLRFFRKDLHQLMLNFASLRELIPAPSSESTVGMVSQMFALELQSRQIYKERITQLSHELRTRLVNLGHVDLVASFAKTASDLVFEAVDSWIFLKEHKDDLPRHARVIVKAYELLDLALARLYGFTDERDVTYTVRTLATPILDFPNQMIMVVGHMMLQAERVLGRKLNTAELQIILLKTKKILFKKATLSRSAAYEYFEKLASLENPFSFVLTDGRLLSVMSAIGEDGPLCHDLNVTGCPALGVHDGKGNIIGKTMDRFAKDFLSARNRN